MPVSEASPGESSKERVDRELRELLEEIRVALPGLELLFGFLLVLPFSERFDQLGDVERGMYLTCFLFTALASALFIAPTAYHRLGFRVIDKERLLRRSNRQVVAGLVLIALAVALVSYIVSSVVLPLPWPIVVGAGIAVWFSLWWFLVRPPGVERGPARRADRRASSRPLA